MTRERDMLEEEEDARKTIIEQTFPEKPGEVFTCKRCNNEIADWQNLVRINDWVQAWNDHKKIFSYYHTRCWFESKIYEWFD